MKKFTFIFDFKGGTYISQFESSSLFEGIILWVSSLDNKDIYGFEKGFKSKIENEILSGEEVATQIQGVDNVWCLSFTLGKNLGLLNVVLTV